MAPDGADRRVEGWIGLDRHRSSEARRRSDDAGQIRHHHSRSCQALAGYAGCRRCGPRGAKPFMADHEGVGPTRFTECSGFSSIARWHNWLWQAGAQTSGHKKARVGTDP